MSISGLTELSQTAAGRAIGSYPGVRGAAVQCVTSGTVNYDVQWSNDGGATWVSHSTITGATAAADGAFNVPVEMVAVNVNSGTGTVTAYIKGATK